MTREQLLILADILEEAAGHLRAVMLTPLGEERALRYFLPDELEGSAIMLREEAESR